jgi:hypothetical protein
MVALRNTKVDQHSKPLAKLRKPKMVEAAELVQPSLFDRQT